MLLFLFVSISEQRKLQLVWAGSAQQPNLLGWTALDEGVGCGSTLTPIALVLVVADRL